jgi:hypothetical protein
MHLFAHAAKKSMKEIRGNLEIDASKEKSAL